jgi:hypothetical protein
MDPPVMAGFLFLMMVISYSNNLPSQMITYRLAMVFNLLVENGESLMGLLFHETY